MPENTLPKDVYGVFCLGINQESAQKLANTFSIASNGGVENIHLLWQSTGGSVSDGIFLYNYFRSLPLNLILYNVGQVSSIATVAYLGAKGRKVSASATFMLHRSTNSPQFATASKLSTLAKSLTLDDERTERILREHIALPDDLWTQLDYHDLYLSAEESLEFGISNEVADFAPPLGTKIFNI
jgi:ATP-dependent Clp protease protease subunit